MNLSPRTLQRLIEATRSLLSEGRLESATIEEIALRAGVSRRSVHNHFGDRAAFATAVLAGIRAELEADIASSLTGVLDPAERMVLGLLVAFRYGLAHRLGEKALLRIAPRMADPAGPGMQRLPAELRAGELRGVFTFVSLDAAVVLVLGLSDVGLAQLQGLPRNSSRAITLMRDLSIVLLQGLRVQPRRVPIVVDAALARLDWTTLHGIADPA